MTHRERFMAVLRGELPDRLPFVPRYELWYRAHSTQGTLPPKYAGKSREDVYAMLESGQPGREARIYKKEYGVEIKVDNQPRTMRRTYVTPFGEVDELFNVDREARERGGPLGGGKAECMVKGPDDFEKAAYVINSAKFIPLYDDYIAYQAKMGDEGEATCSSEYDPFYQLMQDLVGLSNIWYIWSDYKEEVEKLYDVILQKQIKEMIPVITASPANFVTYGRHYDSMMTPRPIFEQYMKPALKIVSGALHDAGKLHAIHADADSKELLELYMESGVDIMECYCAYPMSSITMEETLERVGDKMVVWGGIPSTLVVPSAYDQQYFLDFVDNFFKVLERYKGKSRVVVGIADNVVPGADMERVEIIAERCANFKF